MHFYFCIFGFDYYVTESIVDLEIVGFYHLKLLKNGVTPLDNDAVD